MQQSRGSENLFIVLSVVVSIALAYMASGIFIFTLPLLVLGKRIRKTETWLLIQAVAYMGVMTVVLLPYRGYFRSPYWGTIAFSAMFPLVTSCGTIIYTGMRDKSDSVLRKLVASSIPAFILGTAFAVWLSSEAGRPAFEALNESIHSAMGSGLKLGADLNQVVDFVIPLMILMFVPTSMIFLSLPILINEFAQNSSDEKWQFGIANMKMPKKYVWVVFAGITVIVAARLIDGFPSLIAVAAWNVTLGILLHYLMNGYSILVSFFRRRTAYVSASRVFFLVVILGLIPGVGFAEFTGLAVLGIMENWMKLR